LILHLDILTGNHRGVGLFLRLTT